MKCVYCGAHWSPDKSDYVLVDTGFGIEHNEDPCFNSTHYVRELSKCYTDVLAAFRQ